MEPRVANIEFYVEAIESPFAAVEGLYASIEIDENGEVSNISVPNRFDRNNLSLELQHAAGYDEEQADAVYRYIVNEVEGALYDKIYNEEEVSDKLIFDTVYALDLDKVDFDENHPNSTMIIQEVEVA